MRRQMLSMNWGTADTTGGTSQRESRFAWSSTPQEATAAEQLTDLARKTYAKLRRTAHRWRPSRRGTRAATRPWGADPGRCLGDGPDLLCITGPTAAARERSRYPHATRP